MSKSRKKENRLSALHTFFHCILPTEPTHNANGTRQNINQPQGESDDVKKVESIDDLHKAAKLGDVNRIKSSKLEGVDINAPNAKGLTALHIACREGNMEIVSELLRRGANIEVTTKKLNTPLHIASLGGKLDIVKLLLEHGAEVNMQAENEMTPLYMAAQENHINVAKELLYHNADPRFAASGGFEPVDVAIQQKHSEMTAFLMEQGSKRGFKALHVIARKDAINAAALLLSNGFDPDVAAPNGYTPLHIAAKYGSTDTALLLIEASANVDAAAKNNITPLHVASKHGQTEMVSVLIEAGTKLDVSTKDGLTPLHCASRDGHENCVELLLVHNASLNAKTKHGLTALHMAAQGDHVDCANHLLGHGCHIDSPTLEGVSPLHVATHYGNLKISKLLLDRGANVDNQAKNGYTALHVACKKNREEIVQLLIRYGANVHLKNIRGQTALHLASYFGMVNIVLLLLENEACIEETTNRDETSLHIACRTKQLNVARLLLRNGAKVDPRSTTLETPLFMACQQSCYEIVSLLLDYGANPDARNKDETTYMHIAARNGNEAIIDCLFDHGAKIDLRNKQQCTPLHEAVRFGHTVIARMLIEANANVNAEAMNNLRPLHMGCRYQHTDVSLLLMENGADLQAATKNGFTPLHILSKNNAVDLALHLLSLGVDADTSTKNGISPLHLAAKEGNVIIADALLENGASPGIQTKNGLTPLHIAARYNQLEVSQKLIKYAAPINSQTPSGYTPLHFACFYKHFDIAKLLLEEGANVEAKTRHANTPLHITALKGIPSITELLLKYNAPTNILNKDGFTALHIAEITRSTVITELLVKVTHIVIRNKGSETQEDLQLKYNSPEELEDVEFIEIAEESFVEVAKERLSVSEDFEEPFPGFDESGLPDAYRCDSVASYKQTDLDTSTSTVSRDRAPEISTPVLESPLPAIFLSSEDSIPFENLNEMEPPITRRFLVSFLVDANGGVFESRQTGIRVTIPKGACPMPTRITCRLMRNNQKILMPKLYMNEGLVNRIIETSPQGIQFLKPIILEVPHFGSLRKRERELRVLRNDPDSDFWREHVSTSISSEENGANGVSELPTSPEHGFKSGAQFVRIVTHNFPERFAIIARPREEKFVLFTEAGVFKSSILQNAGVMFEENTLNSSRNISLQVQIMDDSILQPDETSLFSSILRIQPHIKLPVAVTVTIPCPWISENSTSGATANLRLVALMPEKEDNMGEYSQWTWKDVTSVCTLTLVGSCCQFQTSFLTTYWLIEDKMPEKIPSKAESIYRQVCSLPYEVKFIVYAAVLTANSAELRVFCMTDDRTEKALEHMEGFVVVATSRSVEVYDDQTIHLTCNGTIISGSKSLKMSFRPFEENRLAFKVAGLNSSGPWSYRIGFISSLRQDADGRVPLLCGLEAVITEKMLRGKINIPTDVSNYKVSDDLLQRISQKVGGAWKDLGIHLLMAESDIQGAEDLAYGKSEAAKSQAEQDRITWETNPGHPSSDQQILATLTLLELWRTVKGDDASFENLRNALETIGRGDLCDLVECRSPVALSPRSSKSGFPFFNDKPRVKPMNLDEVLTSAENTISSEKSSIENPVDTEIKKEVKSDICVTDQEKTYSYPGVENKVEGSKGFGEEALFEQKIEGGRNEVDLQNLINSLSGDEFFDTIETENFEKSNTLDLNQPEVDDKPNVLADDDIEEEVDFVRPVKDLCDEEQARETVVSDVHCKITDNEFDFMQEDKQIVSNSFNGAMSNDSPDDVRLSTDENSNVGSFQGEHADIVVANGNASDETQETEDVIKRMFAGEQSVLAFFDTSQKTTESNDRSPVTFV